VVVVLVPAGAGAGLGEGGAGLGEATPTRSAGLFVDAPVRVDRGEEVELSCHGGHYAEGV
jgi:hypothetical protein